MSPLLDDACQIFKAAVRSVMADRLVAAFDWNAHLPQPITTFDRVIVLGVGKAAMAMAGAVEAQVRVDAGLVVVPHGYRTTLPGSQRPPAAVEVIEAGHPVPDADGEAATGRVLRLAGACGENELVVVLLSGGGSALWPAPAEGLSLDQVQAVNRLLLQSGATIHQINAVRKHLSRIKGGHLVGAAYPARVLALVLSDVVGDDLSAIASGPTVPDPTTLEDAREVLHRFGLWDIVPGSVRDRLGNALAETPKPGDPVFAAVKTHLIGSNRMALAAARAEALRQGYQAYVSEGNITGEARQVGKQLARQALTLRTEQPVCLLWGGETTVTLTGRGRGGRNQEVALAAALELDGSSVPILFLSGGTDGIDGPTDAAGAWATPETISRARRRGLEPAHALADNDTYSFFGDLGMLFRTGPTHTNVMDIQIALIQPA